MKPCVKCEPNDTCPVMCAEHHATYPRISITTDGSIESNKFVEDTLKNSSVKKSVDLRDVLAIERLLREAISPEVPFCNDLNLMRQDAIEISKRKILEALKLVQKYSIERGM